MSLIIIIGQDTDIYCFLKNIIVLEVIHRKIHKHIYSNYYLLTTWSLVLDCVTTLWSQFNIYNMCYDFYNRSGFNIATTKYYSIYGTVLFFDHTDTCR